MVCEERMEIAESKNGKVEEENTVTIIRQGKRNY